VAPVREPVAAPPARRTLRKPSGPRTRLRRLDAEARSVLPHVAMGAGIPLALFSLWLWMAPLFTPDAAPDAAATAPIPVHVNATPWAHIEVDGRPIGTTPLGNVPLSGGEHLFRAELPDGTVLTRRVQIDDAHRHVVFP
jgi:hypothetical protein